MSIPFFSKCFMSFSASNRLLNSSKAIIMTKK
jgi:hypothetical protein